MVKRNLRIKCGGAEYEGVFEQNTVNGVTFKTFIAVPKEFECESIRAYNALMFSQYMLQRKIMNDDRLFDKCYLSNHGWKYESGKKCNADGGEQIWPHI